MDGNTDRQQVECVEKEKISVNLLCIRAIVCVKKATGLISRLKGVFEVGK